MKKKSRFIDDLPKEMFSFSDIEKSFGKKLSCVSKGRYGIYHILLNLKSENKFANGNVMIPIYACSSIPEIIKKAGYGVCYYDICESDLNGDLLSIKNTFQRSNSKILLIPSLYGNPANLVEIEDFCEKNDIFMIDDAAQAFGAKIGEKMVGSFGNSGLFSFSAGKPTLGHMGCFFWGEKIQFENKKRHLLYHILEYFNFFYNRYSDYNSNRLYKLKIINYIKIALYKLLNLSDDDLYEFEKKVLLRVVNANFSSWREERMRVICRVSEIVKDSKLRIITTERGTPNNNKIVCVTQSQNEAEKFLFFLKAHNCYCSFGYQLLDKDTANNCPIANKIYNRIVEIPITADEKRNDKTIDAISCWINNS